MLEVRAKLWLERDSVFVMGEGRAELLRGIKREGSLARAARAMGMSYSHAWSEVRAMSRAVGSALVESTSGGARGGGSRLTPLGEALLRQFDDEMKRMVVHLSTRNVRRPKRRF